MVSSVGGRTRTIESSDQSPSNSRTVASRLSRGQNAVAPKPQKSPRSPLTSLSDGAPANVLRSSCDNGSKASGESPTIQSISVAFSEPSEAATKYFPLPDQSRCAGNTRNGPKRPENLPAWASKQCSSGCHVPEAAMRDRPVGDQANDAGKSGRATNGSSDIWITAGAPVSSRSKISTRWLSSRDAAE